METAPPGKFKDGMGAIYGMAYVKRDLLCVKRDLKDVLKLYRHVTCQNMTCVMSKETGNMSKDTNDMPIEI